MDNKIGLVLEGGGFRGLYTAGILHCLLKQGLNFPYIIAVSMGASNATNYLSKQTKRNLDVPYNFVNNKNYMSYWKLFTKGELFGMDFIFNDIPNSLLPFDFDAFDKATSKLVYVTTDCLTGKPHYIPNSNSKQSFKALEASTSLPFASKMVKLNDKLLLDGGIADPIPVKKALEDGCRKAVVILTQPKGYRKSPFKAKMLANLFYKKYPNLVSAILNRYHVYNEQLKLIEKLEEDGKVYIIRPLEKLPISRTEKQQQKLKHAFDVGYDQCETIIKDLIKFTQTEKVLVG